MRRIRAQLTYANVVATLALVLAAGGGAAYAANTVFSSDIVDGEVKTADIGNGQVKSTDLANNQVRAADIGSDQINGSKVADQGLSGVDLLDSSVFSTDLATNSVQSEEILDGSINSDDLQDGSVHIVELAPDSVTSSKVMDGSMRGVDLGAQFVTFNASMPAVSANTCNSGTVSGLPLDARDHLLLTEASDTTRPWIFNLPAYVTNAGQMSIRRCNLANFDEQAGTHKFNLLVINAQ